MSQHLDSQDYSSGGRLEQQIHSRQVRSLREGIEKEMSEGLSLNFEGWPLQGLGRRARDQRIILRRRALMIWERGRRNLEAKGGGNPDKQAGHQKERPRRKEIEEKLDLAVRNHWRPSTREVQWNCSRVIYNIYPILDLATLLTVFCFHVVQCINFLFNCFWICSHG